MGLDRKDRFTIVGGRGFIGSALAATLRERGADVAILTHRDALGDAALGHVIYASGVAASSAGDPSYAFGAHVEGVRRMLDGGRFTSLLYLSSTRVYGASAGTSEGAALSVEPEPGRDAYRASKIAGETLCLATPLPAVRVARLSNVAGASFDSSLFLSDVLRQAARERRVVVRTTRDSAKDYITIGDACRYLLEIAQAGRARLYNVAAGENVENGAIYDFLTAHGIAIEVVPGAARSVTPAIDVRRLRAEFGPARESLLERLPELLDAFTAHAATAVR
jgi:nucleoside-diphosphate-sugar epimerase